MSLADLSIAEAGARLRRRDISATELLEAHLARIAEWGARLHAIEHLTEARARAGAAAADKGFAAGEDHGPLMGIPLAVKSLFGVAGLPTTGGSAVPAAPETAESAVVARLTAGGAVLLGTLATYEFATVGPDDSRPEPPAVNPWNPAHITGGSSSGSASAVAGGLMRAAIGTDTGGSIRSPAAFCGIVGLKPSYGRVSRGGLMALSPSLDHAGPLAASVEEAALTLDAISGSGWGRATERLGQGARGLRIGYLRSWVEDTQTAPAMLRALDDAAATFSLLGARIVELDLPERSLFDDAGAVILSAEAMAEHEARIMAHGATYGRAALKSLLGGALLGAEDLAAGLALVPRLTAHVDAALGEADVLLTATTLAPASEVAAFAGGKAVWTPMRTIAFNVTGHPALSLPCGFDAGLPLGAQLIAPKGREDLLVQAAQAFEMATDFSVQRPPL
ncbi:amidase [Pseudoroseicyclus sp. H15]